MKLLVNGWRKCEDGHIRRRAHRPDPFPLTTAGKDHRFDPATYNYEVKDGIFDHLRRGEDEGSRSFWTDSFKRVLRRKAIERRCDHVKQYLKPLFIIGCSFNASSAVNCYCNTTTTVLPIHYWKEMGNVPQKYSNVADMRSSSRLHATIYSDAFKDVTPTLTITGDSCRIRSYSNDQRGWSLWLREGSLTSVQGTKEQYIKNQYDDLKTWKTYNKHNLPHSFEFNDEKYEIHQTLKRYYH